MIEEVRYQDSYINLNPIIFNYFVNYKYTQFLITFFFNFNFKLNLFGLNQKVN